MQASLAQSPGPAQQETQGGDQRTGGEFISRGGKKEEPQTTTGDKLALTGGARGGGESAPWKSSVNKDARSSGCRLRFQAGTQQRSKKRSKSCIQSQVFKISRRAVEDLVLKSIVHRCLWIFFDLASPSADEGVECSAPTNDNRFSRRTAPKTVFRRRFGAGYLDQASPCSQGQGRDASWWSASR